MKNNPAERLRAYRYGLWAEAWVVLFLSLKGYRLIARRWKTPVGEIDLLMRKNKTVAVIEVKYRALQNHALEAVSPRQLERLQRAAAYAQSRFPRLAPLTWRFDMVALSPWRWPCHLTNISL